VITTTIRLQFDRSSTDNSTTYVTLWAAALRTEQTSCAWRHNMPPPLSSHPRGRPSASRAAEQTQRSSSFPTPITFSRSPLHLPHALGRDE